MTQVAVYTLRFQVSCCVTQRITSNRMTGAGAHSAASYQMRNGAVSLRVRGPGLRAGHSPTSGAEFENGWSYTSTPPCIFLMYYLIKHRYNFYGSFLLFHVSYSGTYTERTNYCDVPFLLLLICRAATAVVEI
jgi:hypothetical protein